MPLILVLVLVLVLVLALFYTTCLMPLILVQVLHHTGLNFTVTYLRGSLLFGRRFPHWRLPLCPPLLGHWLCEHM